MKNLMNASGLLITAVLFITSIGAAQATQQPLKIGFVNSSKVLQELPEAIEAQRKLDAHTRKVQDSLETLSNQYQTKLQEYQQKQALMTEDARRAAQQELIQLEQQALALRERQFGRDGEYARLQEKLLDPIYLKAKKAIEEVAQEEKLSFVFDKTETVQILLYGDSKFDYTFKVIDKLKRSR